MNTNHNRIKVADLETNQPNKILTTNSTGELEFSNLNSIKIDNYNGLDYTIEGKALDARQGKELKNLIDTKTNSKIDKAFGPSQANKLLGTDANGDFKLYPLSTFSVYPPPYLEEILPLSVLPNSTGNITLKGSFFTPTMTVSIEGQTVNFITFLNDNSIKINLTTGSLEGAFNITFNNGISATFNNSLLVVLGVVHKPTSSDWINVIQPIDISEEGSLKISQYDFLASAILDKNKISIKSLTNFRFVFNFENTPFEKYPKVQDFSTKVTFYRVNDNIPVYSFDLYLAGGYIDDSPNHYAALQIRSGENLSNVTVPDLSRNSTKTWNEEIRLQRLNGIMSLYTGGSLKVSFNYCENSEMYVKFETRKVDFLNIKYIELSV